eukprot:603471_1
MDCRDHKIDGKAWLVQERKPFTVDVSTYLKDKKTRGSLAKLYKALNQVVTVKQIGAKQVVQMPSNLEDYSVEHMVYLIENNDTILCDKLKLYFFSNRWMAIR